jgi:signal transduction histidine kinase
MSESAQLDAPILLGRGRDVSADANVAQAQSLRDDTLNLIVERIRTGLWLILASISLFAVLDIFINREVLVPLWTIKGVEVALIAATYLAIQHTPTNRRAIPLALALIAALCLGTALSSAYTGDLNSTPLLMVTLSLATAAVFPWGVRPQLFVGACTVLAVFLNRYWVVPHESTVFAHVVVAMAVSMLAGVWATTTLDRYRAERQRAEEILAETRTRQHQAELAQAARLASLGEMAAGLAHELNQPLSAIVSYARGCALRMRADGMAPETFLEVIEEISSQAFRAGEVLRRIREFLRHGQMQREAADLNDLVRFAAGEARELGVQVDLQLTTGALPVGVDKIQVEQVILNLVRNGFDAMQRIPTGQRRLTVTTAPDDHGSARVTIADTGVGISPEVANKLFDPFFTTKRDGLGLGLSISRSIIEAHGGRLWIAPDARPGAAFHFTVPTMREVSGANAA